jgi:hypothetical protein
VDRVEREAWYSLLIVVSGLLELVLLVNLGTLLSIRATDLTGVAIGQTVLLMLFILLVVIVLGQLMPRTKTIEEEMKELGIEPDKEEPEPDSDEEEQEQSDQEKDLDR